MATYMQMHILPLETPIHLTFQMGLIKYSSMVAVDGIPIRRCLTEELAASLRMNLIQRTLRSLLNIKV